MVHSDYTVGCDAHKHFSLFTVLDEAGQLVQQVRIGHVPGAIGDFLSQFPEGTPVALETVGNWYWIVDEIEAAACIPLLAHAAKAKVMMVITDYHDGQRAHPCRAPAARPTSSMPTAWPPCSTWASSPLSGSHRPRSVTSVSCPAPG